MNARQQQFNSLVRLFTQRMMDAETLAPGAEPHKTLVSVLALLGGGGFTLLLIFGMRYLYVVSNLPEAARRMAVWSDQLLVLLLGCSVTLFFATMAWESLFPGRQEALILRPLPVSTRTITGARLYAFGLFFCLLNVALHVFPLLSLPLLTQPQDGTLWSAGRYFAAQAVTVLTAGAFVFCVAITIQALLILVLPWWLFERVSSLCQIAFLLVSCMILFLNPGVAYARAPGHEWVQWLPSFWFLDLWQELAGMSTTLDGPLAWRAVTATAIVIALALVGVLAGMPRSMRKAVEGREPRERGPSIAARAAAAVINVLWLRNPRERAVFWFAARTVLRHRSHRLMLCVFIGIAAAAVLESVSSILYGAGSWTKPSTGTAAVPLLVPVLVVIGLRALFAMPVEPKSNWSFRLAGGNDTAALVAGGRKLMQFSGLAVLALFVPLCAAWWGLAVALPYLVCLALTLLILTEYLMRMFVKVPFACTWLPGKANLQVRLGAWLILFMALASFIAETGVWMMTRATWKGCATWYAIAALAWLWARVRREASAQAPAPQYDERADQGLLDLGLSA